VAISNRRVAFDVPSPGGEGQGEGGLSLTPSMLVANNTVENPHNSKAKSCKNTVENQQSTAAVPSPGGEG